MNSRAGVSNQDFDPYAWLPACRGMPAGQAQNPQFSPVAQGPTSAPATAPAAQAVHAASCCGLVCFAALATSAVNACGFDAGGVPLTIAALEKYDGSAADAINTLAAWSAALNSCPTTDLIGQWAGLEGASRGLCLLSDFNKNGGFSVGYTGAGGCNAGWGSTLNYPTGCVITFMHELQEIAGCDNDNADVRNNPCGTPAHCNNFKSCGVGYQCFDTAFQQYWGTDYGINPCSWKCAKTGAYRCGALTGALPGGPVPGGPAPAPPPPPSYAGLIVDPRILPYCSANQCYVNRYGTTASIIGGQNTSHFNGTAQAQPRGRYGCCGCCCTPAPSPTPTPSPAPNPTPAGPPPVSCINSMPAGEWWNQPPPQYYTCANHKCTFLNPTQCQITTDKLTLCTAGGHRCPYMPCYMGVSPWPTPHDFQNGAFCGMLPCPWQPHGRVCNFGGPSPAQPASPTYGLPPPGDFCFHCPGIQPPNPPSPQPAPSPCQFPECNITDPPDEPCAPWEQGEPPCQPAPTPQPPNPNPGGIGPMGIIGTSWQGKCCFGGLGGVSGSGWTAPPPTTPCTNPPPPAPGPGCGPQPGPCNPCCFGGCVYSRAGMQRAGVPQTVGVMNPVNPQEHHWCGGITGNQGGGWQGGWCGQGFGGDWHGGCHGGGCNPGVPPSGNTTTALSCGYNPTSFCQWDQTPNGVQAWQWAQLNTPQNQQGLFSTWGGLNGQCNTNNNWGMCNDTNEDIAEAWLQNNWGLLGAPPTPPPPVCVPPPPPPPLPPGFENVGLCAQTGQQNNPYFSPTVVPLTGVGVGGPGPTTGQGTTHAHGGMVDVALSPGEKVHLPDGGQRYVPGKPKVKGDSEKNDTFHTELPKGAIVVPRTVSGKPKKEARFVAAIRAKKSPGQALRRAHGG